MAGPFLIVSGTNRPGSNAIVVARLLLRIYERAALPAALFDLVDLPIELLAPEAYEHKPAPFEPVRDAVVAARGLHIVVPEYTGSFPGVLKLFLDHLKYPESFEHKPVAFVGESSGRFGGLRAVEQLQHVFGYRNAYVFPDRVFIPSIDGELEANDGEPGAAVQSRLERQVRGFAGFAAAVAKP